MGLYILQSVLHNTVFCNQIFQFPTIGILLNALRDDTEAIKVNLLILRVLKVIPDKPAYQSLNHSLNQLIDQWIHFNWSSAGNLIPLFTIAAMLNTTYQKSNTANMK